MTLTLDAQIHRMQGERGHHVSTQHRHIDELAQGFDRNLYLVKVPADVMADRDPELGAFDFALIHEHPERFQSYVVRWVRTEDMNADLLAWIYNANSPHDLAGQLEAKEKAEKDLLDKAAREAMDEKLDFAASVIGGKNYYRHDGITYS